MPLPTQRQSFLIPLTLVELTLILVFILLLINASFKKNNRKDQVLIAAYQDEKAAFQFELTQSKSRIEALKTEILENNRKNQVLIAAYQDEKAALQSELTQGKDRIYALEAEILEMRKPSGYGRDIPPCWLDKSKNIEYLFSVKIREYGFDVLPAWPVSRDVDVQSIPGVREIISPNLSIKEFEKRVIPIFRWSVDRNCRFYVQVIDNTKSKLAFKKKILVIEKYFYKYLVGGI